MKDLKIVFLIDADNTQMYKLDGVLQKVSTYGRIIVKRAYGNWKKDTLKNWESELKRLAIKAEQQFDYVLGKNATDMALVIDAVDLLHRGIYNGFVIVASDSDYTPLAIYLRESGVYVIGAGEKKTPESFRNSCDEFIFLEQISGSAYEIEEKPDFSVPEEPSADSLTNIIHRLLWNAAAKYKNQQGFVNVSSAGQFIKRELPDFDVRNLGFKKLTNFIEAFPDKYEVKKAPRQGKVTIVTYRCKDL